MLTKLIGNKQLLFQMRVFETYKGKIYKFYGKGSDLSAVQSNDTIIMQVSVVVLYELLVCLIQDFSAFYCFYSYTVLVRVTYHYM